MGSIHSGEEVFYQVQRQQRLAEHQHLVSYQCTLLENIHQKNHLVAELQFVQLIPVPKEAVPPPLVSTDGCGIIQTFHQVIRLVRPGCHLLYHRHPVTVKFLDITVVIITTVLLFITNEILQTSFLIIKILLVLFPLLSQEQNAGMVPNPGQILNIIEQTSFLSSLQFAVWSNLASLGIVL